MKILIYGINFYPELTGIGKYTGDMAFWLNSNGNDVKVITAPPYYPKWCVTSDEYHALRYKHEEINYVDITRCPLYVPKTPKTITRVLHLVSFALTSTPILIKQVFWKPDIIFVVEPTLFCSPLALIAGRLSGAKCLLHIQDFELDAMLGLGMGNDSIFTKVGKAIEKWLMKRFDAVSSISISMLELAKVKTGNAVKLIYFPNWVDVEHIQPNCDRSVYLNKWKIPEKTKIVLYSGNIGKKQGLEIILTAAEKLKTISPNVLFVIVGDGAAKEDMVNRASEMNLTNIQFFPLEPYEKLSWLMALADIHLVIQKKGAADFVLPSKLTTIFSAGGTVLITSEKDTELGNLCEEYPGIAHRVDPENPLKFTAALSDLLSLINVSKRDFNHIARAYAVENLEKNNVLNRFNKDLEALIGK